MVSIDNILQYLQLPLFVKPNNGGSSIGMSKVVDAALLQQAIEKAFLEDDQVLLVLPATEIISHRAFFDYEAKYSGGHEEVTSARADEDILAELRNAAKKVYQLLNCRGVVRIDFIYNEPQGEPYMPEVNTVPGKAKPVLFQSK